MTVIVADRLIRVSTAAAVVGIGAVAAYVSYRHAYDVVTGHGEAGATARLLPLTIDGLVFVASMVMLDSARRGQSAPALAKVALALGIGSTVAVNVLHGVAHGSIGAIIAAWPAVTLVVVVELLMEMIRRGRAGAGAPAEPVRDAVEVSPAAARVPVMAGAPDPAITQDLAQDLAAVPQALTAVPRAPAREVLETDGPVLASARERFAEQLAAGDLPSLARIRGEMRVGHPRAVRIRAALAEGPGEPSGR
ncbi:MAG: hypothetical protein JWO67_7030 [Streptosporangiaceae bacterium]|nr:hypothetical protein [Streptosporangiaceae bacterium]